MEQESHSRAIWLATHDGVFIGAPVVEQRYSVSRTPDGTTVVSKPSGYGDLRNSILQLGWSPEDSFFASTVLFCEGPSDQLIFEHCLCEMSRADPRYGGVLAAQLGGSGAVWSRDRAALLRNVDLASRIAVHARFVCVLDGDGRPQSERDALTKSLAAKGVNTRFLAVHELEAYWCIPEVARDLLELVAREQNLTPNEEISSERVTEVDAMGDSQRKPSERLEALWRHFLTSKYDKVAGARAVLRLPNAGGLFKSLVSDLAQAIGETERAG